MSEQGDKIEEEIAHLRKLEGQIIDQKTLDGIKALIADLEAEKEALQSGKDRGPHPA